MHNILTWKKSELGPHANEEQMPSWLGELFLPRETNYSNFICVTICKHILIWEKSLTDVKIVKLLQSDGEVTTINRLVEGGRLKKVKVCLNQAPGIIPVLAQLLEQDSYTDVAYLCHPAVKHISKLRREGKFGSAIAHLSC